MQKIHIVSDSASDIPPQTANDLNIEILPILITYDDKTICEFYDVTPEEYWDLLLNLDTIPKTAQVTIDSFLNCFKNAKNKGVTHLLYVAINSKGSGTYATSLIARDMFYEENGKEMHIEIIDSKLYSYLYGSVCVNAAKNAASGLEFDKIVQTANEELSSICAYLGVYDLKFLKKSGRISGGAAFVGEALGLRPISRVYNGDVLVCDKVRSDNNVIKKIVDIIIKECKNPEETTAFIIHGLCSNDKIETAKDLLLNKARFKNVETIKLGAAITTNAGPNSIAVAFYR